MASIVKWDIDAAEYVGDGDNGVYFLVQRYSGSKHKKGWYFTAVVDCEHFTQDIYTDDGPYRTEKDAERAAFSIAYEWCRDNDVDPDGL